MRRRKIKIGWTCCDDCHSEHPNKIVAYFHWLYLRKHHKITIEEQMYRAGIWDRPTPWEMAKKQKKLSKEAIEAMNRIADEAMENYVGITESTVLNPIEERLMFYGDYNKDPTELNGLHKRFFVTKNGTITAVRRKRKK